MLPAVLRALLRSSAVHRPGGATVPSGRFLSHPEPPRRRPEVRSAIAGGPSTEGTARRSVAVGEWRTPVRWTVMGCGRAPCLTASSGRPEAFVGGMPGRHSHPPEAPGAIPRPFLVRDGGAARARPPRPRWIRGSPGNGAACRPVGRGVLSRSVGCSGREAGIVRVQPRSGGPGSLFVPRGASARTPCGTNR